MRLSYIVMAALTLDRLIGLLEDYKSANKPNHTVAAVNNAINDLIVNTPKSVEIADSKYSTIYRKYNGIITIAFYSSAGILLKMFYCLVNNRVGRFIKMSATKDTFTVAELLAYFKQNC